MRAPWGQFLQMAVMGRGRWMLVLALVAAVGSGDRGLWRR